MTSQYFDLLGEYSVELRGDSGRLIDQFPQMYDHFSVNRLDGDPDVICEVTTEEPTPETVLGDPDRHYGRDGDRFVVRNGSNFLVAEPGWEHIWASPGWEPFYVVYLVEFGLRRRLAEEGRALMHASGLRLDGTTVLFPAWRSAGKTNTMLSLMRVGASYLSDDRLWVSSDGSAVGYPLGVNLNSHNTASFPELTDRESTEILRSRLSDFVGNHVDPGRSVIDKALTFVDAFYLSPNGREYEDPSKLVRWTEYVPQSDVDHVVLLTAAPGRETIDLRSISPADALSEIVAISHYEWNGRLMEYFRAFDALFPHADRSTQLESLIDRERRVFAELLETVDTHRAFVPRSDDWTGTATADDLVDEIRALGQPPRVDRRSMHD